MGRKGSGAAAFEAGARVEARRSGDGAWYEATVTQVLPRRRGYSIVYANHDPSHPLPESVLKSRVRPRPPLFGASAVEWGVHQLVEVYSKDGWRVGVVADVGDGGKYRVSLPDIREVSEFTASDIRPRLVWRDHQWFASDDAHQAGSMFGVGKQVEVSGDTENYGVVWFPGTVVKVIDKTTFFVEYNKPQEDGGTNLIGEILDAQYIRPVPQPTPQNMVFRLLEEIEVCHCGIWMAGVVTKIIDDSEYIVRLKYGKEEEIELNHSDLRTRCNWINGRWTCSSKRGRLSQLPLPFSLSSSCDIERTSKINLKCKMGGEQSCEGQVEALQPRKKLRKEVLVTPAMEIEALAISEGFEAGPNELVLGSFSGEAGLDEDLSFGELSEDPSLPKSSSTSVRVARGEESLNPKGGGSGHSEREVLAASHGLESPSNELVISSFHGEAGLAGILPLDEPSKDSCLRKCSCTSELIVRVADSSNFMGGGSEHSHIINHSFSSHETGHDSVLATDLGNFPKRNEMFAIHKRCQEDPKITDARHHSNAEMKSKKDMPLKESTESISRMNGSLPSVSSVKTLPFKKNSKMWEIVHSMEVFHRMPQDPCFRKLEQCPMNLREGAAIGLMVSFSGLADSVSELRISDSLSTFEEKLEDLKRLEENGFDVLCIRERIEELLEIRNILKLIEKEKTKLEYQVSEGEKENEQFGAPGEIDKAIKELEQKLACLYEKRSYFDVQRSNLSNLQKDLQAAKESCQSGKDSFERIRYSPW